MEKIITILILLIFLIILVGCSSNCDEFTIRETTKANCDELINSYQCCKDKSVTVWGSGNCDKQYSELIARRCD